MTRFHGAKLALLMDGQVLTYLRDDFPHLPFPAHWDLPGGGREGGETPEDCALRELHEEFGLTLPPDRLIWRREFRWTHRQDRSAWFFGGHITAAEVAAIRFGTEGQHWRMMPLTLFLSHPKAVPDLQTRLRAWLSDT